MSSGDYYRLLGLSRSASVDDIKAAFRVAAKKYHPDVNRDKGEKAEAEAADHFKLIQAAYATLSNPAERRSYDLTHPRAGRVAQASSAEYEAAGGGASGGYAEWDPKTAARRAAAASSAAGRPFNAGAGFARTAKAPHGFGTGGVDESSEEPYIDYSQWNAAHFGPTAQERERYTAQRVKEAKQTGFSGYNDANASRGANWAHRKAARDRAKEWEEVFGSGDEDSSNTGDASGPAAGGPQATRPFGPGASLGESETAHYRRYAAAFRAQKAAAERAWPLRLMFWGTAVGVLLYGAKQITKPPGAK